MGYTTVFTFRHEEGSAEEYKQMIQELSEFLEDPFFVETQEYEGKWYDQDEDCRKLALKYSNIGFSVNGIGESGEDFWRTYYKGEIVVTKQIVFDFPTWDEVMAWAKKRPGAKRSL